MNVGVRQIVARVEHAETQLSRMTQLRKMSTAELTAQFADPETAAPWIETAAVCGIAEAQVQFGRMLLEGNGVAANQEAALRWFLKAARMGNAEAQNMAGRCFELGWGCEADWGKAAAWYHRAAASGLDWGEYNYANMLFDGRGVEQDQQVAVEYYQRAARRGHAKAMNLLARCMEEGWGTPRDGRGAAEWYRRSAEAGYFRAQFNHAIELLSQGRATNAAIWLERAKTEADGPLLELIDTLANKIQLVSSLEKAPSIGLPVR